MKLLTIARKEIAHRRTNFVLGLLAVAAAVACLVGSMELLRMHDRRTEQILAEKQAAVEEKMAQMSADVNSAVEKLGFNVVILPADQNLGDFYADDYASEYMPQEYVDRLADSDLMTVKHLIPRLRTKLKWQDTGWTVIVVGVGGVVSGAGPEVGDQFVLSVPRREVVVGHEIARGLELAAGQTINLKGREFRIARVRPEQGSKDDITLFLNLADAQEVLDKAGEINEILAVQARAALGKLAKVREEITGVLPDTRVIEKGNEVLARAQAVNSMQETHQQAIARTRQERADLKSRRKTSAGVLVGVVFIAALTCVSLLSLRNVWNRRLEIGTFRAIGVGSGQVFALLFFRPVVMGIGGGLIGFLAGKGFGILLEALRPGALSLALDGSDALSLGIALATAVGVAALAGLWPVARALRMDPAVVLRSE